MSKRAYFIGVVSITVSFLLGTWIGRRGRDVESYWNGMKSGYQSGYDSGLIYAAGQREPAPPPPGFEDDPAYQAEVIRLPDGSLGLLPAPAFRTVAP